MAAQAEVDPWGALIQETINLNTLKQTPSLLKRIN